MPKVTQAQYIAHYQSIIKAQQKLIVDGFTTFSYQQMGNLMKAVKENKRRINFARSGQMKDFFI